MQTYCFFEARIKASPGGTDNVGMCPAFWLPNVMNNGDDGNHEIDVMEIPGNPRFGNGHTVWGTVHTLKDVNGRRHGNLTIPGYFSDGHHDFAVDWSPAHLAWSVDGKEFYRTTEAAFIPRTPAYMVLDNEVGLGHLDGPDGGWAGNPAHTPFPQFMHIDHVRVWQRKSVFTMAESSPFFV